MDYNISKPSEFLSPFVKQYWSLECCSPKDNEHIQRIVPNGLFEIIFYLEDRPESTDSQKSITENIILSGQLKNFYDLKVTGNLSLFAVYFFPQGLSMFLDMPLKELFNQSIPLKYIIKDSVNRLEDELLAETTFKNKIQIIEQFLFAQIKRTEKKYKYERIRHIVNQINQLKGIVEIDALASESFLSRKQFERTFAEIIGTSPKQFLKTVRFQNAIFEKSQHPEMNITDLTYKCGYYDQAHMINDFKTLSGLTPKKYFENRDSISDYFE